MRKMTMRMMTSPSTAMTTSVRCRGCNILAVSAALLAAGLQTSARAAPEAVFRNDAELTTTEGHVTLKWRADGDSLVYQLQSARAADFQQPTSRYHGMQDAYFLSGLADGKYWFRVRAKKSENDAWGPWSDSVVLKCKHHSLIFAWILFASGGMLFLLIVLFVGINARDLGRFERNNA